MSTTRFGPRLSAFGRKMATAASKDPFTALEHRMWEAGALNYSKGWGPLTSQAAGPLLDAARVATGSRVLDVATGPGIVASAAAKRGPSEVLALDFSEEMLELAKHSSAEFPNMRFIHGDAQALPLEDSSLDAVVVAFGLLHLPRPMECLREAHRCLKPGGWLSYAVWDVPAKARGFKVVLDAIAAHGNSSNELPGGSEVLPFFHFADPKANEETLVEIGFNQATVESKSVPLTLTLADPDDMFQNFATATARTRATLETQTEEQLEAIRRAMSEAVNKEFGPAPLEIPMPCVVTCAQKC